MINELAPEPSERIKVASTPPGTGLDLSTNAPAPSPNKMQVPRSFQLTTRDSVSEPMTRTVSIAPERIALAPMPRAYIKPEQAAERSKAPAFEAPNVSCTRQAVAGKT